MRRSRPDGGRGQLLPGHQRAEDRRGAETLLLRELAHRVNNVFAVIQAMAQQDLRTVASKEEFSESFIGRLQALARAHSLLLAVDWRGVDLRLLMRAQVEPLIPDAEERLCIEGPPVTLAPPQAIALGMIQHELATNACKHGALATARGRLQLNWLVRANGARRLRLNGIERGAAGTAQTPPTGLGGRLIERGMPKARVDWAITADGLACRITMPLEGMQPPG